MPYIWSKAANIGEIIENLKAFAAGNALYWDKAANIGDLLL